MHSHRTSTPPANGGHPIQGSHTRAGLLVGALTLALSLPAQALPNEGSNLLANGGFDSSLSGWTEESHSNFTSNWTDDENLGGAAGSGALIGEGKTESPPAVHHVAWQCVTVKPGRSYMLRGALKSYVLDEVSGKGGSIVVYPATASGCAEAGEPLESFTLKAAYGSSPWETNQARVAMPAHVSRVQVAARVDAGHFISDARQENQSNFVGYDQIELVELLGDLAPRFGESTPASVLPKTTFDIPVLLENRSGNTAYVQQVRIGHADRLRLNGFTCPGAVTDTSSGDQHYFNWFDIGAVAGGSTLTCTLHVEAVEGFSGLVTLGISATSDNEADTSDNLALHGLEVLAAPDVAVGITTTEFPQAGDAVVADLTLRNRGTQAAQPVFTFHWKDPAGTVTLPGFADSCGEFFYDNGQAIAAFPLAAGAVRSCRLSFTWPAGQSEDLTATISASQNGDYALSNNSASDVSKLLRLTVDTTADGADLVPGDGRCEAHNGVGNRCTLRAAVMEANAVHGFQAIELPAAALPYLLDRGASDGADHGDIEITSGMRIIGVPVDGAHPELRLEFDSAEPGRAFRVQPGNSGYVLIENLDIVGQRLAFNGHGGLVSHINGKLRLRNVALEDGRSLGKGGAIHSTGELVLEQVTVRNSTAATGGGLAFEPPTFDFLTIHDSRFSGNGGAATGRGGGIWLTRGLAGIDASTFDGNRADYGGGLLAEAAGFGTVIWNSTLSGNIADLEGGGLWLGSALGLNTSTIADNQAAPGDSSAGLGGGAFVAAGVSATSYGSIWVGNEAQTRAAVGSPFPLSYPHAAACHGTIESQGYNTIQTISTDQLCTSTSIDGDRFDSHASLAPLADNGGPVPTRALAANGDEVDRGDPACLRTAGGNPLLVDQRGRARPADGDGDGMARCDKGAFERTDIARLTVTRSGNGQGRVNSSPNGISCGDSCSSVFAADTAVTLSALPSLGNRFVGWSGDCSGSASTCTVAVDGERLVDAQFASSTAHRLDVSMLGGGSGAVNSLPSGIACPDDCDGSFADGSSVTLSAVADAGSVFTGWSGGYCSGSGDCVLTMDAPRQVEATFAPLTHTLSIGLFGDGSGTVSDSVHTIDCPTACVADVADGSTVSLSATPASGSTFLRWDAGPCASETNASCTFPMSADQSPVAVFAKLTDPQLTITVDGSGTVTSQPAGIDCGSQCSAGFARGTVVTLTASAASGQQFDGWDIGPCAGSSDPVCAVTMELSTTVSAGFVETAAPPAGNRVFHDGFE